jgi:hypothetical protein
LGPRIPAAWCRRIKRRDGLDPATARLRLSSLALRAFLAKQETLARPSSAALRAYGCGPAVVALSTAIRPRWARSWLCRNLRAKSDDLKITLFQ